MNNPVISNPPPDQHIGACGLFCTNCGAFKKGKCQGCQISPGFSCCPVRRCCVEKTITTCAECPEFAAPRDYRQCKKLNSFVARIFALVFKSDRPGALNLLRTLGRDAYLAAKRTSGKQ